MTSRFNSSKWRSCFYAFGGCFAPKQSSRRIDSIHDLWASIGLDIQECVLHRAFSQCTPKEIAKLRLVCRHWTLFSRQMIISLTPTELIPIKLPGAFPNLTSLDLRSLICTPPRFHVLLKVRQLTSLYLSSLEDEGMVVFTQLTNLRELDLEGVVVPDKKLIKLCDSLCKLELLNLKQCASLSQLGINALSLLTKLKYLSLESVFNGDVELDLSPLLAMTNLELLNLGNCTSVGDRTMETIGEIHSLRQFYALLRYDQRSKVTDIGISLLLYGLTNLQILCISYNKRYSFRSFSELGRLSTLEKLTVAKMECARGWIFPIFAQLTSLKHLEVDGCSQLLRQQIMHLTALTQLTSLVLSVGERPIYPRSLDDNVLGTLSIMSKLKTLTVNGYRSVTGHTIGRFGSLTSLNLRGCQDLSDRYFTGLSGLSRLRTLSHEYCNGLTDDSFTSIASIPKLETLSISINSRIQGLNLHVLSALTGLIELELKRCDDLQDELVLQLTKIVSLKKIDFSGSRALSEFVVKAFCKVKPELEVQIPSRSG
eukprot:g3275.t1